jgi:hypothetical protein
VSGLFRLPKDPTDSGYAGDLPPADGRRIEAPPFAINIASNGTFHYYVTIGI